MIAAEVDGDDPCERFAPHILDENEYDPIDASLASKMHKAMAVLEFKLEAQLLQRHPNMAWQTASFCPSWFSKTAQ